MKRAVEGVEEVFRISFHPKRIINQPIKEPLERVEANIPLNACMMTIRANQR